MFLHHLVLLFLLFLTNTFSLLQKIAFMVALGLVTTEHLEGEITLPVQLAGSSPQ